MRILLVGGGGREHALAWRFVLDRPGSDLHAAPGNPGIAELGVCHPVAADDLDGLSRLAERLRPDVVVVGPEAPLVAGLADLLGSRSLAVFGPSAAAARIEGSKAYAKNVLRAAGVPTAEPLRHATSPCVVKADGLAAGKGVFVCRTADEVAEALTTAASFGGDVVVEELLEGDEVSVFAVCDGRRAVAIGAVRDYKRVGDGDEGPNTGGMGSFTPVPGYGPADVEELVQQIHEPVLAELRRRGAPFVGTLFAGLMLTSSGPRVLEFNCRFGDPETQSLVPALEGNLLDVIAAAAAGQLGDTPRPAPAQAAVTVVVAAGDYPARGDAGTPIEGIEGARATGALVFHAGTAVADGRLVTNGGRVLNVVGVGNDVEEARARAYDAVTHIGFAGAKHRTDIAHAVERVHG
jgi:phosphoribosylamine--glycine ligase